MDKKKIAFILHKAQIAAAAVLFLLMLYNCGRYIDLRINGFSKTLSPVPEADRRVLLSAGTGTDAEQNRTFLRPVFIGVKNVVGMHGAGVDSESGKKLAESAFSYMAELFSGQSENVAFGLEKEKEKYINSLKNADNYILLGFLSDIPASCVLPCISDYGYDYTKQMYFNFRNLFILPDSDGNLYGIAVSSSLDVNILKPDGDFQFNAKELESYNNSTGFVPFEFADTPYVKPLLKNTVNVHDFRVSTAADKLGRQTDSDWILSTMQAFSLNLNLAKTFVTRDGSVLNYVDGSNELLFYQNGDVVFNSADDGVHLSEYLGYNPQSKDGYTFGQKLEAVRKLTEMLDKEITGNYADLCFYEAVYTASGDRLEIRLKYFADAVSVTEKEYDAVFAISSNSLVYASYSALCCDKLEGRDSFIPQYYADMLSGGNENSVSYAVLERKDENSDVYKAVWASKIETSAKGE